MFMQGAAIWHPRCGPGPEGETGYSSSEIDKQVRINFFVKCLDNL